MGEKVAILDAGSQYTKVIDRTVRELNVEGDILPIDSKSEDLKDYKAVIVSGGPASVYEEGAPRIDEEIYSLGKPVLGICYGLHLMNFHFKGKIEQLEAREYGTTKIDVDPDSELFKGMQKEQKVYMSHGDSIKELAQGFKVMAKSENDIIASIGDNDRKMYAVQFHPEVYHTENGKDVLHNFLYGVAEFSGDYTQENKIEKAVTSIQAKVGDKKVLALLSGGVDSAVMVALLLKSLDPAQVYAAHIDNGFMRKNESDEVYESLKRLGLKEDNFKLVRAAETFYNATTIFEGEDTPKLKMVGHSEVKRNIIGDTFMKEADKVINEFDLPEDTYLAQGTLRPDLIESASELVSKTAHTIKTHHNDTTFVREKRDRGLVVEPNKDYHKYEVREVGRELGLPDDIVNRQPFPGPGTSIRIICADRPWYGKVIEQKDYLKFGLISGPIKFFWDSLKNRIQSDDDIKKVRKITSLYGYQSNVLPIRTVGVQGDGRTYANAVALSGKMDWDAMRECTQEITTNTKTINRVVYVLNGDKLNLIDGLDIGITRTFLEKEVIDLQRELEYAVNNVIKEFGLETKIDQMPIVLFPADFGQKGKWSVAIRPVQTPDFMTLEPTKIGSENMPIECLEKIVKKLSEFEEIAAICYDITDKPPATTEWE